MHSENNFYNFNTISCIEIDVTSNCNAFCGRCQRNGSTGGPTISDLPLVSLSHSKWKSLISKRNLQYINEIKLNGNFGDFSMHPNIIDMLEELNQIKPDIVINAHTNGGARNKIFWKQLASVLKKFHNHRVVFGIDGLEDSHSIYRRGVSWDNVMRNATAFINEGGFAIWKSIVFDYNIHQLKDMEAKAKEKGFSIFQTNRSTTSPLHMIAYKNFPKTTITSPTLDNFLPYKIQKIFKEEVKNPKKEKNKQAVEPNGSFNCLYGKEGTILVDMEGYVWPCCYLSGERFDNNNFKYTNKLNIQNNTLEEILNDDIFKLYLKKSWTDKTIKTCNKCDGIYDPSPVYKV